MILRYTTPEHLVGCSELGAFQVDEFDYTGKEIEISGKILSVWSPVWVDESAFSDRSCADLDRGEILVHLLCSP